MAEAISTEVVIIGAGVIGLSIAERLAKHHEVILLEANEKFGQETSSRNSEVIHSGIYYPPDSRKTALCLRGRKLLYDFCAQAKVPYRKCGKLLVGTASDQTAYIEKLAAHCQILEVPFERYSKKTIQEKEPNLEVGEGLFFPESGIVDSHQLMAALERRAIQAGAQLAYRHSLTQIACEGNDWVVQWETAEGKGTARAGRVINAAGLAAARWSNQALGTTKYSHRFCRGKYFHLKSNYRNKFSHLVYPVPEKDGLGVHVTLDLSGDVRLGPDVEWCGNSSFEERSQWYECDWEKSRGSFLKAAQRLCPQLRAEDLTPGLIGIRPKLFLNGEPRPDFLIENHDGYIHCLGIESPGLTAALAIAEQVGEI